MSFEQFLTLIYEIVAGILKFIWWIITGIYSLIVNSGKEPSIELNERYVAEFSDINKVMSKDAWGFSLNGKFAVDTETALKGGIAIGGSGYGKSTCVITPSAFQMEGHSMIFHDSSGEIKKATAGFFQSRSNGILTLNYNRPDISIGYNPLARVKTITDAQKVANLLVRSALGKGGADSAFWNTSASAFLTMLILIVLKQEPQYRNLANVKHLLDNYNAGALDKLVAGMNDRFILNEYKNYVSMDAKLISSIIATCRSALNLWNSPELQLITSHDTIDFKSFRDNKTILYIQVNTLDLPFYSPITSIFFEQFFSELMSELPSKNDNCVFFMIDEFSSLYIPSIQIAAANLRKFKSNIFAIVQSENQIREIYGDHITNSLLQNMFCKVYFPSQDADTCNKISKMLGRREIEIEDKETGKKERRTRELLTPDEVRVLGEDRALLFVGTKALYVNMYPYYQQKKLKAYSEIPASPVTTELPFNSVPLIRL